MAIVIRHAPFLDLLDHMVQHGSSVLLNWGEDTEVWECSWITDGKRYSGFSKDPLTAARKACHNAGVGNEDCSE